MAITALPKRWSLRPTLGVQINQGHPLANGLIQDYEFSETGGAAIRDLVFPFGALTANGNFSWLPTSQGVTWTGNSQSSSYLSTTNPQFWGGPQTWEFLGNPVINSFAFIFDKSGGYYIVRLNGSSQWEFTRFMGTTNLSVHSTKTASTNTLYHVVLTWDGTVNISGVQIWINGIQDTVGGTAGVGTIFTDPNSSLVVGADSTTPSQGWQGSINVLRTWNRILTPAEIQQLYLDPYSMLLPQAPK